ncbi:MAG: hypothetical protein KKC37_05360, partial [Proteobacteria bacterium]|nr:hypothetical protein [Pseudomonadota bacterium]
MDFSDLSKDDLVNYVEFLMHNYRVMDAFWYINLEQRHGSAEADAVNALVWGKTAQLAARDLKKRYGLEGGGLSAYVRALRLFPWTIIVGYDIQEKENEVIIEVASCPSQTARLDRGLGEYACQAMHRSEFENFAREIDPRIKVECLFAPPDDHPPDRHCSWRFTLGED